MTDAPVSQPPAAPPASGLAIAGLICGCGGIFLALIGICTVGLGAVLGLIAGIVGLVLSILAMRRIRRSAGQMGGRGLAVGGLATSIAAIVLGLLIAAAVGGLMFFAFSQVKDEAQQGRIDMTKLKMKSMETALEAYSVNIGHYPTEQEGGLEALRIKPAFNNQQLAEQWRGPYLREEPRDAWGNKFNYRVTRPGTSEADQTPYRLWSNGPDGMNDTDDDIKNWSDSAEMPSGLAEPSAGPAAR